MTELFITKRLISRSKSSSHEQGVRAYRDSPETVHLQIIRKTAKQTDWTGVALTFDEARQLAQHLISEAQS